MIKLVLMLHSALSCGGNGSLTWPKHDVLDVSWGDSFNTIATGLSVGSCNLLPLLPCCSKSSNDDHLHPDVVFRELFATHDHNVLNFMAAAWVV